MCEYTVYTDGACSGNPGPGGWAAIVVSRDNDAVKEVSGFEQDTTNNRMELMAAIEGIKSLPDSIVLKLITDSKYVKLGITEWIIGWKKSNWKTSSNKPVKNKELWQELDALNEGRAITWEWVKGHSGDFFNDKVDELARNAIEYMKKNG